MTISLLASKDASERFVVGRDDQYYGRKLQQEQPSGEIELFGDIR